MTTRTADPHHLDVEVVEPGGWHRRRTLRDGTPVLLRQIRAQDRDRLAAGFRALSPASRYLRFHQDLTELTPEQLTYLTAVDHVDHEAIVAIDLGREGTPGIGVARFIRDPFDRRVAEAMVTVADTYHGQGAATLLLGALAARGRQEHVEVFRHHVLASNEAMLEVFDHLGATRELEAGGRWRVDLELPERARDLPDSPAGRAFLAAGRDRSSLVGRLRAALHRRLLTSAALPPASPGTGVGSEDTGADLVTWLADRDQRVAQWPVGTDIGDTGGRGSTAVVQERNGRPDASDAATPPRAGVRLTR